MKIIYLAIVLLYLGQYAHADVTLEYKDQLESNSPPSITYQIKQHLLKMSESDSKRINIFDAHKQEFVTFDVATGNKWPLNKQVLKQRIDHLNQQRLEKIAEVERGLEDKLKNLSEEQQAISESLINQLRYPEYYGDHTRLQVKAVDKYKQIKQLKCRIYQLYQNNSLIKQFCITDADSLNMTPQEYKTLRGFYAFNYHTFSQLMLASGRSNFTLVDYDQQNMPGVIIETIDYQSNKISQHLTLDTFTASTLDSSIFSIESKQ